MRVAWLAPFNLPLLASHLPPLSGHYHPAPWITNGVRAMAAAGGVYAVVAVLFLDATLRDRGMPRRRMLGSAEVPRL